MTDTNGVQVIAGMRPRVWGNNGNSCTPMTSRAAHVDMGLLQEAGSGSIGDKSLAHGFGGGGEKLVHGR